MRNRLWFVALLGIAGGVDAAPPGVMVPGETVKCDVRLNVTDPDPKGLNVRAAPKVAPDNILGALKPEGEWTEVHVVGNTGEWFLIDAATMIDDNAPNGERSAFKGRGWVHRSKVGDIQIRPRDILSAPEPGAKSLFNGSDPDKTPAFKVLACKGKFVQVQGAKFSGWAKEVCTNQRTTCV